MDPRTRDYLIRAHNKVIAHYHRVLEATSLVQPERERVQKRLADVKAELEEIERPHAPRPTQLSDAA